MESRESLVLFQLNKEYLNIFYSKVYQKHLKKEKLKEYIKKRKFNEIWHIIKGRLIIKKLVSKKHVTQINHFNYCSVSCPRIVVYTCIIGDYDILQEPLYVNRNIDYVIFTDNDIQVDSMWKKIDTNKIDSLNELNNKDKNRYVKMMPHKFFKKYDYSIYIDGTIQIITDLMPIINQMGKANLGVHLHPLRDCIYMEAQGIIYSKRAEKQTVLKQIKRYERECYPKHNGLYENTILVRKHNDDECVKLMIAWWNEYMQSSKRDQLSLPYIIWNTSYPKEKIVILGDDLSLNPRFCRKLSHKTENR